jgi:hypothetical protein
MQRVTLDTDYWLLQREWEAVPIPADARPAAGSDGHLVVHQPSTDTLWEFWRFQRGPDGWHARWGGKMRHVSRNPGAFPAPLGATATGLPLIAGLIRPEELRRGHIDHALAFSLPEARAGVFARPATRTDGQTDSPGAIPLGTRFRIDPDLDLGRLSLTPVGRMIAEAAQRYGIVVRDKGGSISFYGEDPAPTGTNPWYGTSGWFAGRSPNQVLARFPWDRLRLLRMDLR